MITCPTCEEKLPAEAFGRDSSRASGLQRVCKVCKRNVNKAAYKRDGSRHKRYNIRVLNTMRRVSHLIVARALRTYEIEKSPCEGCGSRKTDAHHDDYSLPLDVRWLCRSCHKQWHVENGPGRNADVDGEALAEEYGRPRREPRDR